MTSAPIRLPRRRAIVFDLDGTLVDSAPDLAAATDHVLHTFGRPPVGLEAVRKLVGDGARALVVRGFESTGALPPPEQIDRAVEIFLDHYAANIAAHTRPFPGVVAALDRLRDAGLRLGICTNKREGLTHALLRELGLAGYFDAVVGGDTLPVRKPDGGHLLGTLAAMQSGPADAVMVGDSINDISAARSAGVPVVAVSFGYTGIAPADLGADTLIDHFDDLWGALAAFD
jgi:phosphoglycolate phosphatase